MAASGSSPCTRRPGRTSASAPPTSARPSRSPPPTSARSAPRDGLARPVPLPRPARSEALLELEMNSDLKAQLRELNITAAKEIEVGGGRKAIIIFVPVPQLKSFQKIQVRLVRELEKKFSGKHVVFIAQRRILPKPTRKSRTKNKQKRPRSRTLTAVHDAILEDLVFPSEIVGKRIRVKLDGSRLIKVHLDKAQQNNVEHKVETFSGVYKKLTGKDVNFEFPLSLDFHFMIRSLWINFGAYRKGVTE
uniref:40S ribosomal protein S7 n=1 Tax=Ornithorhynchus anatinus TaxID=9258 RepID=A0A6I8NZV6_ORNAN